MRFLSTDQQTLLNDIIPKLLDKSLTQKFSEKMKLAREVMGRRKDISISFTSFGRLLRRVLIKLFMFCLCDREPFGIHNALSLVTQYENIWTGVRLKWSYGRFSSFVLYVTARFRWNFIIGLLMLSAPNNSCIALYSPLCILVRYWDCLLFWTVVTIENCFSFISFHHQTSVGIKRNYTVQVHFVQVKNNWLEQKQTPVTHSNLLNIPTQQN